MLSYLKGQHLYKEGNLHTTQNRKQYTVNQF